MSDTRVNWRWMARRVRRVTCWPNQLARPGEAPASRPGLSEMRDLALVSDHSTGSGRMNTDFFSGVFAAFACIGLGALIALAWRGTRPEPPPRDPWKEMDSYGPVPPDEFSVEEWERTGEQVRETSCGNRDCTNPAHYEGVWDVMRKVGEASITPTRP